MNVSFELILSAVSILVGAMGSIAGAISMVYISKARSAKMLRLSCKGSTYSSKRWNIKSMTPSLKNIE